MFCLTVFAIIRMVFCMMWRLRQSLIFENNNELTVRLLVDGANWFRVLAEDNQRFMLRMTCYII